MIDITNIKSIKVQAKKFLVNKKIKSILILFINFCVTFLFYMFEKIVFSAFKLKPLFTIFYSENIDNILNLDFSNIYYSISENILSLFLSTIMIVLNVIIIFPLTLGTIKWFYLNTFDDKNNISIIFDFFSTPKIYFKSIFIKLNLTLKFIFFTIIFNIPFILSLLNIKFLNNYDNVMSQNLLPFIYILSTFIFIIFNLASFLFLLRYFLVYFIFITNKNIKISDILKLSIKTMKNYKLNLFSLISSFIFLYLLSIFILPMFFIIPYIYTSLSIYAKNLIKNI